MKRLLTVGLLALMTSCAAGAVPAQTPCRPLADYDTFKAESSMALVFTGDSNQVSGGRVEVLIDTETNEWLAFGILESMGLACMIDFGVNGKEDPDSL